MDFANLFNQFDKQEKNMMSCFCVLTPLCFTILYLYIPVFKEMEAYIQFTFSAAMSIACVYHSFIFRSIFFIKMNIEMNKSDLIIPTILAVVFIIPTDIFFGYNIWQVYIIIFFSNLFYIGSRFLSARKVAKSKENEDC